MALGKPVTAPFPHARAGLAAGRRAAPGAPLAASAPCPRPAPGPPHIVREPSFGWVLRRLRACAPRPGLPGGGGAPPENRAPRRPRGVASSRPHARRPMSPGRRGSFSPEGGFLATRGDDRREPAGTPRPAGPLRRSGRPGSVSLSTIGLGGCAPCPPPPGGALSRPAEAPSTPVASVPSPPQPARPRCPVTGGGGRLFPSEGGLAPRGAPPAARARRRSAPGRSRSGVGRPRAGLVNSVFSSVREGDRPREVLERGGEKTPGEAQGVGWEARKDNTSRNEGKGNLKRMRE